MVDNEFDFYEDSSSDSLSTNSASEDYLLDQIEESILTNNFDLFCQQINTIKSNDDSKEYETKIMILTCLDGGEYMNENYIENYNEFEEKMEHIENINRNLIKNKDLLKSQFRYKFNKSKYEKFVNFLLDKRFQCSFEAFANLSRKTIDVDLLKRFVEIWKEQIGSHPFQNLNDSQKAQIFNNSISANASFSLDNKYSTLAFFLDEGFDIHFVDGFGCNCLYYSLDNFELTKYLVENMKVSWNQKTNENRTLVHELSSRSDSNIQVFQYLIDIFGRDVVNEQDSDGMTPLMICVQSGSQEIGSILLQLGAKLDIKSNSGETVMDFNGMGYFDLNDIL